jgi:hypothetical protein
MANEIANSIHAAAVVQFDSSGTPSFAPNGNQGFAAWGTTAKNSQKVADGRFKLRMIAPVNLAKGEAVALVVPIGPKGFFPDDYDGPYTAYLSLDPSDMAVINVQTQWTYCPGGPGRSAKNTPEQQPANRGAASASEPSPTPSCYVPDANVDFSLVVIRLAQQQTTSVS